MLSKYKLYIFAAVSGIFAAYFVAGLISYISVPDVAIPRAAVTVRQSSSGQAQLASSVLERNIFAVDQNLPPDIAAALASNIANNPGGVGGPAGSGSGEDLGFSPQASLNGKLTGVFLDRSGKLGIAILVVGDKDVFVLRLGQKTELYELVDLTINSATINYFGQNYTLEIEGNALSAGAQRPVTPGRISAKPVTDSIAGGTEQITLTRGELMNELSDINKVLSSLLVGPLHQDGQFLGYRINRMNADSPIKALGLAQGDVINRINGEELTNPELLFNMLAKVNEISSVSLDVTRGNEKKTLFVEIQ